MYSIENKSEESRAIQNNSEKHEPIAQFKDNRSLSAVGVGQNTAQLEKKENLTGMPDDLKEGIESLSGFSMDDVRVHYNSSKPATVQALAYTQGTDIHVAPGQEKHLPHEAWHVAQQMAGRVSPTTNINGMPVNDNAELEHEADVMGEKATQLKRTEKKQERGECVSQCKNLIQRRSLQGAIYVRKGRIITVGTPTAPQGTPINHLYYGAGVLRQNIIKPESFPNVHTMGHLIKHAWCGYNEPEYINQWSENNENDWTNNVEKPLEEKAEKCSLPSQTVSVETNEPNLGDRILGKDYKEACCRFSGIQLVQYTEALKTLNRQVTDLTIKLNGNLIAKKHYNEPTDLKANYSSKK